MLHINCTSDKYYVEQGALLKQKKCWNGFSPSTNWTSIQVSRETQNSVSKQIQLITKYHSKFKNREQVIAKHWSIILEDPHLKNTLSPKHKFAYRRARNVLSLVTPSKLKSVNNLQTKNFGENSFH